MKKEGLAADYSNDPDTKKIMRRVAALPFVPLEKVDEVRADSVAYSPYDRQVINIMNYVTTAWI